jgi:hypothetical protein
MIHVPRNRPFLIALGVFLVFAALFAEAFVFTHIDHDHTGEDCLVCLQIETVQSLLKSFALAGSAALFLWLERQANALKSSSYYALLLPDLVSLKVRFNS